jgi:threonine dehydrogenase-like Zn-dependent dehydrogenase
VKHTIDARSQDPLAALEGLTGGDLPTVVFDATGNPKSMQASFAYPSAGGRLVFVGLCQSDISFNDPHLHRRELSVLASRNSLAGDFVRIMELMRARRIDISPWVTHRASFDATPGAFDSWTRPETGVIKAMISLD